MIPPCCIFPPYTIVYFRMDVYDLAEWCCMADLTRLSIENGNAPVAVPDFTRGNWNKVDGYHHAFAQ